MGGMIWVGHQLYRETRIFELDIASTQQRKKQFLQQANVPIPAQLAFVSIDFERDTLAEVLTRAGFNENKKALFIWEGVTYYLSVRAVDKTLAFVRSHSPVSSNICFDYMIHAPDMSARYGVKAAKEAMSLTVN
jgi:methyltransferase (TIGR00027 family)